MGGGSAQVNAHYQVTPFDGVVAKVGEARASATSRAAPIHKLLPLLDASLLLAGTAGDERGLTIEYFNELCVPAGEPVHAAQILPTSASSSGSAHLPAGVQRARSRRAPPRASSHARDGRLHASASSAPGQAACLWMGGRSSTTGHSRRRARTSSASALRKRRRWFAFAGRP